MVDHCVFCKIIAKELPAQPVYETDLMIVIKDIAPKAPIHFLIIPKKHIPDLICLQPEDHNLAAQILMTAQVVAQQQNISAFRLVSNNGQSVGQSVFHVHFHFVAGKTMEF